MRTLQSQLKPPHPLPNIVLPIAFSVSDSAWANGSTLAAYRHGISLVNQSSTFTGILALLGGIGLAMTGYALSIGLNWGVWSFYFLPFAVGALVSLCMIRADFVGHRYEPLMFDRATKRVHAFVSRRPAWWRFWAWRCGWRIESFDLACLHPEIVESTHVGQSSTTVSYALWLAAVDRPGSPNVHRRFRVGLSCPKSADHAVWIWEHIRRFMTENGAHVVSGDTMFHDPSVHSFWACLTFGQPLLGPGSRPWWNGSAINGWWWATVPFGIAWLVLLPATVPAGILRWLSYAAKQEPRWPANILASVGEKLDVNSPQMVAARAGVSGVARAGP